MKILISSQHLDLGESFQSHIKTKLTSTVKKYFENAIQANVHLTKDKHQFIQCDILVNEGTGTNTILKSTGYDNDPYRSFDLALAKIEKQLKRYKGRIKNHHKNKQEILFHASKYVLSSEEEDIQAPNDVPMIIAENSTAVESLTVSDAVMKMDLHDLPVLLFVNKANGRINLVYHRKDGNISWMDLPKGSA
jgi:ribosomal subunit interface protein